MAALPYLIFFTSGFAALVYQVVWQRMLVIFSGSDIQSTTIIVAAFMAGLGCGSFAGGKIADRLPPVLGLAAFAAAELAIAGFGFFSATLYYDVLYQRLGHLSWSLEARAAILFVSLLWPTFFMGVSLPLLARTLTTDIGRAAGVTGALYGWNTLGAALGAFATTWWMLPLLGLKNTLQIGATLNLFAALIAIPLALRMRGRRVDRAAIASSDSAVHRTTEGFTLPFAGWTVICGLAGFLALSLEIVWFRLIGVMLRSTAFTFGTLLAMYLTGLGLGSLAGSALVRRARRPGNAFLTIQAAVTVYAALAITLLIATVDHGPLASYVASHEQLNITAAAAAFRGAFRGLASLPDRFLLLYFGIPAILIGPPTAMMGAAFPLLQHAVQTDLDRVGRRVGTLLMANIAGAALGSFVTGWLCLAWLGTSGTLKLLVVMSVMFPLALLMRSLRERNGASEAHRRPAIGRLAIAGAAIAGIGVLLAWMPDAGSLWSGVHGARPAAILFGEDGSGVFVLKSERGTFRRRVTVFVNGSSHSWIPYGGIHTVLGALPAFLHPDPRDAAVIGLGSGDTLFAIAGRKEIQTIACIEIVKPQLPTLGRLQREQPYPGLEAILGDRRIEQVYGDGRLYLMQSKRLFDLIEADPLVPTSAYAGNLYSHGYFTLVRDRLKPNGLAVSWAPTIRVRNTFITVFPHVLDYGDIVIGSKEQIAVDAEAIRARLSDPDVRARYKDSGVDILPLLAPYLDRQPRIYGPADDRSPMLDINTDLFPKDEFGLPAQSGSEP
ncbi:MAG TPA: fused MFS/spermidine synthase [Vicinamibacterales bacterium]|jgi:predicted membrane-bound spermidine synthase|nr:fused MFS/spermidine synthase [Vicinamibacterales bacterium]